MKTFTYENMRWLADDIKGDMTRFPASAVRTFAEVYENLVDLDNRLSAVEEATALSYEYDAETRGIIISNGGDDAEAEG